MLKKLVPKHSVNAILIQTKQNCHVLLAELPGTCETSKTSPTHGPTINHISLEEETAKILTVAIMVPCMTCYRLYPKIKCIWHISDSLNSLLYT